MYPKALSLEEAVMWLSNFKWCFCVNGTASENVSSLTRAKEFFNN